MPTSSPNVESTTGLLTLFQTTFPTASREGGSRIPSVSSNSCKRGALCEDCKIMCSWLELTTLFADDFARLLPPPRSHFSAASSASVHSGHMVGFLTVSLKFNKLSNIGGMIRQSNDPLLSLYLCEAELSLSLDDSCFPRPPCWDLPGMVSTVHVLGYRVRVCRIVMATDHVTSMPAVVRNI